VILELQITTRTHEKTILPYHVSQIQADNDIKTKKNISQTKTTSPFHGAHQLPTEQHHKLRPGELRKKTRCNA
jgi:hypothetical protein